MYIIMNIREQCALYPNSSGITLGLINGFFDASAGVFLAFKFIYDADLPNVTVPQMFSYYTMGVGLIWVKLFFFCPRYDVKKEENYTILSDSFVGSFFKSTKIETVETKVEEVKPVTWQEYKKSVFSLNFLLFNIFSIITTLRISSIPIWILPWLKWTFQDFPEDEASELVSKNMDIYGIMFYASIIICPIPGMILKGIEKFICKEKLRAEYYGLIWFSLFTALFCAVLSFQMCIIGSEANATSLVIEFSFLRTIYFISRSMYLFQQFPAEHFGLLYGICIFMLAGTQYAIEPLFKLIQGTEGEMDFVLVSFSMGIACAACIYLPIYNVIVAKRFLTKRDSSQNRNDSMMSKKDTFADEL
ncbi:Oidioi.mRNA.OKI2018_I69.XSR.g15174.t1.cds [Oikopleura dioica]|uniref:Oidioi.mRNA.OKI2018_I69.XSR.g15174.t1.cds n=1 Tax=Oikopleura dioica TaxID=34765 RepID=A0ABN7SG02_OIKDI|nr:Oidioi.mRNA.OKI2018_I69.XSR.g15174.t1.cds [Oikopleura dioica]